MKSKPSESPLSSASLRHCPKRFERIIGMSVENFDDVVARVSQKRLESLLSKQVLWDAERTERLHERTSRDLAEQVCITLLYQRQYMTQEVLGACFRIEQGSLSNIIARIEPWLEAALPTPEALSHSIADHIEAMPAEMVENFSLVAIGDGAEQAKQRPVNAEEQREDYSGKKNFTPIKYRFLEHRQVRFLISPPAWAALFTTSSNGSVFDGTVACNAFLV